MVSLAVLTLAVGEVRTAMHDLHVDHMIALSLSKRILEADLHNSHFEHTSGYTSMSSTWRARSMMKRKRGSTSRPSKV